MMRMLKGGTITAVALALAVGSAPARAAEASKAPFGKLSNGSEVRR